VTGLPRSFFAVGSRDLAPLLLNKVLVRGGRSGRIVEVEAYAGAADPASHAFRGRTARNATMFGPPGHLYVYFTYGMHFCANVVCGPEGEASAVLLRGLTPLTGVEEMRAARGPAARAERDLCSGPGKLCQALGIVRSLDGADLVTGDQGVSLGDDGTAPPAQPGVSGRIGISVAAEVPWRFYVPDAVGVSHAR
jgi:DNA-3-methyladenine glycosylase